jgi:hypothetical protein
MRPTGRCGRWPRGAACRRASAACWPCSRWEPDRSSADDRCCIDPAGERRRAAPVPAVQAVQRSSLRREGRGRGRALCPSAGARGGAVDRRKVADSASRSDAAEPADEARPLGDDDPRRQAQRHDHPVRRPQRTRRNGDRPEPAAPSPPGVHPVPQRHRAADPGRQRSMSCSTITPLTSTRRSRLGSPTTHAGPSTEPSWVSRRIAQPAVCRSGLARVMHCGW